MSLLPVFLRLERRPCLVVGSGSVALAKIESLLSTGAVITVVAPQAGAGVRELASSGRLVWHQRVFGAADLDGAFVVIAATNDSAVNHAVYEEALQRTRDDDWQPLLRLLLLAAKRHDPALPEWKRRFRETHPGFPLLAQIEGVGTPV